MTGRSLLQKDCRNSVSTFMINISLHENIHDQTTLTCGKEMEIQGESGHDNTEEVGRAWMERYAIAQNYELRGQDRLHGPGGDLGRVLPDDDQGQ